MDINRKTAFQVLLEVEEKGAYSNIALNRFLREAGECDPAFVRELTYGVIKNKYLLDFFLENFVKKGFKKLKTRDIVLLREGAYQILFMDSVPSYAAVSETVNLAKKYAKGREGFINGVLRNLAREKDSLKLPSEEDPISCISVRYSCEPWIAELLIRTYGYEGARAFMEKVNGTPDLSIRVNILKNTPEELIKILEEQGFSVRPSELSDRALLVKGSGILESAAFREGRFSVQDQSSVFCADMLMAEPGMRVMDICAAPGGKTAAVAEKMKDQGEVLAFDIYEHKLKLMDELMKRNGISIVKTAEGDGRIFNEKYEGSFDRVLCDVPCSGLGVMGRKPELKYRKEYPMEDLNRIQREILENASRYLRPGGIMVYSTCTVNPSENQDMISGFLEGRSSFVKDKEFCLDPVKDGCDGFYICRILREA